MTICKASGNMVFPTLLCTFGQLSCNWVRSPSLNYMHVNSMKCIGFHPKLRAIECLESGCHSYP